MSQTSRRGRPRNLLNALSIATLIVLAAIGRSSADGRQTGTLHGRVVFSGSDLAPPTDIPPLRIQIWKASEEEARARAVYFAGPATLPRPVSVRPDGTFEFADLAAGSYRLALLRTPTGWWLRSAMFGAQDVLDVPLEIPADNAPLPEVVLKFIDRHSEVSGTVRPAGAESRPFVYVIPREEEFRVMSSRRVKATWCDEGGHFVLQDLPPGTYLIIATAREPDRSIEWSQPGHLAFWASLAAEAMTLTLTEGERKRQDLSLK